MQNFRYSILISNRNEGDSLRNTIDSIFAHSPEGEVEIVIVDDASSDHSTDFLQEASYTGRPIRVALNEKRRGLIFSRHRAASMARGRYLTFLDAHSVVTPDWLSRLEDCLERIEGRGIAVPTVYSLNKKNWAIEYASFPHTGCTLSNPFLDFSWTDPRQVDGMQCTCAITGMAWMCSKHWYDHLGGLDGGMVGWGGENIDISLRTWVAGGWCLVAADVSVGHLYKGSFREPIDQAVLLANKIRAAHTLFSKEIFERIIDNLRHIPGFREALNQVYSVPGELSALKDRLESIRKRSDRWIIDTFKLPLLEMACFHFPDGRPESPQYFKRRFNHHGMPRPTVSLIVHFKQNRKCLDGFLKSLQACTTYRNFEIFVIMEEPLERKNEITAVNQSVHLLSLHGPLGDSLNMNLGASLGASSFFAILDDSTIILDENWIEKFLLLFENHPRLVLACPRTLRFAGNESQKVPRLELFDMYWDWDSPGFSRIRDGSPFAPAPYQAFSCPETLLFFRKDHFLQLGGFDLTTSSYTDRILDFSIRTWLYGLEIYCHPEIAVGNKTSLDATRGRHESPKSSAFDGASLLITALKYFQNQDRIRFLYHHCLHHSTVPLERVTNAIRERRNLQSRLKFDDDWLFFKFGIEGPDVEKFGNFFCDGSNQQESELIPQQRQPF